MSSKKFLTVALVISGFCLGSTTSAFADNTPSATPSVSSHNSEYQAQLAAYKIAMTQYNVARITNDINYRAAMKKYWADWQTTLQNFNTSWQATVAAFQTAHTAYHAKFDPLQAAHRSVLDAADAAFLAATSGSPTTDALTAAIKAYWSANTTENASYKTAVAALGAAPAWPIKPTSPVKPVAPLKPTDPTKPVAPVKSK